MVKVLKDLFVALLNATLILIALCLFLTLLIFNRANDLTEKFAEQLEVITPVRDSVKDTKADISALRSELNDLANQSDTPTPEALDQLKTDVEGLSARLDSMQTTLAKLEGTPDRLLDQALSKVGHHISDSAMRIRECGSTGNPAL